MSMSNEDIRKAIEAFEKRHNKDRKNMAKAFKRQERNEKICKFIYYSFILFSIIGVFFLIKNGFDKETVYVSECRSYESAYQKAYYSEYSLLHDEWDEWDEYVSDVYEVSTLNGELLSSNNDKYYKNTYDFYSVPMPKIIYTEKEDGFDYYQEHRERFIYVSLEDGREYVDSNLNTYKKCLEHYYSEEGIVADTFYGDISNLNF